VTLPRSKGQKSVTAAWVNPKHNKKGVMLVNWTTVPEITMCFEKTDPRRPARLVILKEHFDIIIRLTEREGLITIFSLADLALEEYTCEVSHDFIKKMEDEFHDSEQVAMEDDDVEGALQPRQLI
jgi:hypothetical protein